MKLTAGVIAAFAATALAAPSPTEKLAPRKVAAGCSSAVTLDASTNVFKQYKLHANFFYREEVMAAVEQITDEDMKRAAREVADVGSFLWM